MREIDGWPEAPRAATREREQPSPNASSANVSSAPNLTSTTQEETRARVRQAIVDNFQGMWRLLRRMRVPPQALEDAVQEVFLVAVRRMDDIQPGSERSYLYGIALRVASRARSASPHIDPGEGAEIADPGPLPDALADRRRALEQLDKTLDAMSPDLRAAFVLFEIEGLTLPEIATIFDVPLGTATSRLRRAREVFHEQIARRRAGGPR